MDSLIALMLWPLVAWSIEPAPSWPLRWLTQRWLTYLGQISYMVYLLHLFMPEVTWLLASRAGVADAMLSRAVLVPVWAVSTIAVAMLSWHLIEQPILSRRRPSG
jgi:peptidoglycan/LPS O-acetylase OafA/YrhL